MSRQASFKGKNKLIVNQTTAIEAVQHWINDQLLNPFGQKARVLSFRRRRTTAGLEYVIEIEPFEAAEVAAKQIAQRSEKLPAPSN